jgi:hypothetical protein
VRITIPSTLDAATRSLEGIDQLLTAKGLERAAVVTAFTYEGRGGPRTAQHSVQLTIRQFTELGIAGLRSQESVRNHRRLYELAKEHGAPEARPGMKITLPDFEWSWDEVSTDHARRYVERDGAAVARAIERGDLNVETLAQNLSDEAAAALVDRIAEDRYPIVQRSQQDAVLRTHNERAGQWPGGRFPNTPRAGDILPTDPSLLRIGAELGEINVRIREIRRLLADLSGDELASAAEQIDHTAGMLTLLHAYAAGSKNVDAELAALLAEEA